MLSLTRVSNINNSVGLQSKKSKIDRGNISTVIIVTSIWFDNNQRNLIFLDKHAFGFASFISWQLFELILTFFFLFYLLLLLLSLFFWLFLHSFFGLCGILLNQTLGSKFLDDWWNKFVIVAFSVLLNSNVQSLIDNFEVLPGDIADHFPSFDASLIISL